jgi:hypothetical protein
MAQNRAHPTVFGCRAEYLRALTGGEGGFAPTVSSKAFSLRLSRLVMASLCRAAQLVCNLVCNFSTS